MTRPLLSGLAATIVGTLGLVLAGLAPVLPSPWAVPVGVVGFLAAVLAGMSARPPSVVAGSPLLQGTALTLATGALTLLVQFYSAVPAGWPQSLALGVAALLCWLTGQALPQLGSAPLPGSSSPPAKADKVTSLDEATRILGEGQ